MSTSPDLSLPAKAPSMARYHDKPMTTHPTAIYTLVEMNENELERLARKCEDGCIENGHEAGTTVRPAPEPQFVGQPLRAVFDYHLELGTRDTFEPRYFIAATGKDWETKGVLLVTLDDDELECNVDSYRTKAADAGLTVVNLQIDNSSWEEEKEAYELQPDHEHGGDDDDSAPSSSENSTDEDDDDDDDDDDDGPPAPPKNAPLGYYVPIYIHSSLSEDRVTSRLEPTFERKSPNEFVCRIQAKLTPPTSSEPLVIRDLIQQALALHPLRCAKNPFLLKSHILVVDTTSPDRNGMLMVKLPQWGVRSNLRKTKKAELRRMGRDLADATTEHIRVPFSCYEGLQSRFLTLANGDAQWPSKEVRDRPVFIVFMYNTHGKELGFGASSLDPNAARRKPGEERVLYAPDLVKNPEQGLERISWSYDEAVRRFPWFCQEKRFIEGLDTSFFICVDGDNAVDNGILLGRRHWDGNMWDRTRDELLSLPLEGVKSVRVPIKQALQLLERGRKGDTDGMSLEVKNFFL